ncbi:hypothetical protein RxyAA322_01030 [Rubrobacter xylanophilus]|uniref:Methyltransferase type 12 n=1 Tax=Rubrobacter xylanophilus TaxID=49319 RepID=A0A510HEA2_9ACTN|nr:methyltransferase domain-containing protein [Rubrobacter xylanophilus]BBL78249.1 hypothetical protein RxyAA322_01030 [Rubrobacter xylanophilus]
MRVGGEDYRIVHPEAAEALIDEADFERDERLPYWADLWPSAIALAERLAAEDLRGVQAIELGCGVGLPSVVALRHGSEVLATDHYGAALDFAAYNARINTGKNLSTALLDWHAPDLRGFRGRFELVFAADVLYEGRHAEALARLVPRLLDPGGAALVADPGREGCAAFLAVMRRSGFRVESERREVRRPGRGVSILVHRISR